jgi:hypothetical protein
MANDNRDYSEKQPLTPPAQRASSNVIPIRGPAARTEISHNPDLDYQSPNPLFVLGSVNITLKLLVIVLSLVVFAGLIWLMFHNWMVPGPRQPGGQKANPALQQRIP